MGNKKGGGGGRTGAGRAAGRAYPTSDWVRWKEGSGRGSRRYSAKFGEVEEIGGDRYQHVSMHYQQASKSVNVSAAVRLRDNTAWEIGRGRIYGQLDNRDILSAIAAAKRS